MPPVGSRRARRSTRPRRTQAERRAATQARLLDATVEVIAEKGYGASSTTEIVRRAGVSRGAQVHHFPTKAALVAAAMEHVFARRFEEFDAAFTALPETERRADVALDVLWSMFQGPTFDAWLELKVAARTDRELRSRFVPVDRRFREGVGEVFASLFPAFIGPDSDAALDFALTVLTGLSVLSLFEDRAARAAHAAVVLGQLKALAAMFFPAPERNSADA